MTDVIDLAARRGRRRPPQEREDQYEDALAVLDDILNLSDGQALFVFNVRGKLRSAKVRGSRFYEVDPESLL